MTLSSHIEKVRDQLRKGGFTSEAAVSQGILLPALSELGWPVFDTSVVIPEYSLEGRRVDYALCHPSSHPSVFIEVKKVGFSGGADRQLFEYAFHEGVPMAILTDGQEWSFYLPGEQGRYDERRVYKLDLLERDIEEAANRLERYLGFPKVCSGEALRAARTDYQNVARNREIAATLPRAWSALIGEPDSLLLDLLADKAEDLCGYKPDPDVCAKFLAESQNRREVVTPKPVYEQPRRAPQPAIQTAYQAPGGREVGGFSFVFNGQSYQSGSARDVMLNVFQLLSKADPEFLEHFAARKHGKKRRYIARDRMELYPDRPDLAVHSVEIVPGWWMGTNYSKTNIQQILDLAQEVLDPKLRASLIVKVC